MSCAALPAPAIRGTDSCLVSLGDLLSQKDVHPGLEASKSDRGDDDYTASSRYILFSPQTHSAVDLGWGIVQCPVESCIDGPHKQGDRKLLI